MAAMASSGRVSLRCSTTLLSSPPCGMMVHRQLEVPLGIRSVRVKTGVRDRAREESLAKISEAARSLFVEEGYDAATFSKIAARAELGIGTLYHYVTDKRDLIYLIFNEEFGVITDKALAAARRRQTFQEKMLSISKAHFRFFARDPALSRILLGEIRRQTTGLHLDKHLQIRSRLIDGIEQAILACQQSGEIRTQQDSKQIAKTIFICFSASTRWWLSDPNPDWRAAQVEFSNVLSLFMNGLCHESGSGRSMSPDESESSERVVSRGSRNKRLGSIA